MIVKTMALGLISAVAAGSVMYFGTLPESGAGTDGHPHGRTLDDVKDTIVKRVPFVGDSKTNDGREDLPAGKTAKISEATSTIDGAIPPKPIPPKPNAPKPNVPNPDTPKTEASTEREAPKKRWLDQYLKSQKSDDTARDTDSGVPVEIELYDTPIDPDNTNDATAEQDNIDPDFGSARDTASFNVTAPDNVTASEPPQSQAEILNDILSDESVHTGTSETKDTRFFKIENGILVEVDLPKNTETTTRTVTESTTETVDAYDIRTGSDDEIINIVMTEAGNIKKPELRDQAYFEIVDYALGQGNFVDAETALKKIEQVELRYTAKSRIAVAFAQKGLSGMAFKIISSVDEPELRDFMRLQVIEAMIAPQKLPKDWQDGPSN